MVLSFGIGPPLVNLGVCTSCQHLDSLGFSSGKRIVTVVSVYPARRCTFLLEVVPVGLGDGVGDCHDVANLLRVCLFISLLYLFFLGNIFLKRYFFGECFFTAGYASG